MVLPAIAAGVVAGIAFEGAVRLRDHIVRQVNPNAPTLKEMIIDIHDETGFTAAQHEAVKFLQAIPDTVGRVVGGPSNFGIGITATSGTLAGTLFFGDKIRRLMQPGARIVRNPARPASARLISRTVQQAGGLRQVAVRAAPGVGRVASGGMLVLPVARLLLFPRYEL